MHYHEKLQVVVPVDNTQEFAKIQCVPIYITISSPIEKPQDFA